MARQFVVFALVLFAVVGFACAASPAAAPSADNSDAGAALLAPGSDNEIGNTDGAAAPGTDDVVEGPVGGPEAAAFAPSSQASVSDGSAIKFSAVAGVAAVAGVFFF